MSSREASPLGSALAQIAAGLPYDLAQLPLPDDFRARYALVRLLACGSAGAVFLGRQQELARPVALKFLLTDSPEMRARFRREATALVAIAHPHVLRLLDHGEVEGHPYHCFEYLAGGTLANRIANAGRLPVAEAVEIARQCLSGLGACHAAGIVHRDLKPENVLFGDDGHARLADLGLARDEQSGITREGALLGTPRYMAPEQVRGEAAGETADIYAMGAILYHMLGGRPPFAGEAAIDILRRQLLEAPPPLDALAPGLPPRLVALIHRTLSKDPAARPAGAGALAAELALAADPRAPRSLGSRRGNARLVAASAALWFALGALVVGLAHRGRAPEPPRLPSVAAPDASAGASAVTTATLRAEARELERRIVGPPPRSREEQFRGVLALLARARTALGPRAGYVLTPTLARIAAQELWDRGDALHRLIEESMLNVFMEGHALKAGKADWLAARTAEYDELVRDIRDEAPAMVPVSTDTAVQAAFAEAAKLPLRESFRLLDMRIRSRYAEEVQRWTREHPGSYVGWYVESERLLLDGAYSRELEVLERVLRVVERVLEPGGADGPGADAVLQVWIDASRRHAKNLQRQHLCERVDAEIAYVRARRPRMLELNAKLRPLIDEELGELAAMKAACAGPAR